MGGEQVRKISRLFPLISLFVALAAGQEVDTTSTDSVAMEAIEPIDQLRTASEETKFFGDYTIGLGETSYNNVRIFAGDLFVGGTVEGQIIVVGGDVMLESTAVIKGRIVAIGGTIHRKEGAVITGKVVEANIREGINISEEPVGEAEKFDYYFEYREEKLKRRTTLIHPDINWFVYNRNEGFLFTPINWRWDDRGRSSFRLSLSLGYRFGQRQPAGKLTLDKAFLKKRNFALFASAFRESRTDDSFRLPSDENSLAGLFARQDFYDRWDEEGFEAGAGLDLVWLRLKGKYRAAEVDSISISDRLWEVFHGDRLFRPNMRISSDYIRSFAGTVAVRSRDFDALSSGAGLYLMGEKVIDANTTEVFSRSTAMVSANLELAGGIVIRSRVIGGTSAGVLPEYRYFGIGGLGSVTAHPYKSQSGDRMIQMNAELIFLPDFLDDDWLIALFADAGHAWMNREHGFTDFNAVTKNTLTAIGIGIGDEDMDWRFNISRPLDGRNVWQTNLRFNMHF